MLKSSGISRGFSEALGKAFAWLPVHPNAITLASVLIAIPAAGLVATGYGWEGLALFSLAFLLDGIDGAIARAKGLETKKGAFLDGMSDRMVEFLLICALLFGGFTYKLPLAAALVCTLFFGTCMTSFVKAYAEHSGLLGHDKARAMPGILERGERVALLMLAAALYYAWMFPYEQYAIYAAALLSFATFVQRVILAASSS